MIVFVRVHLKGWGIGWRILFCYGSSRSPLFFLVTLLIIKANAIKLERAVEKEGGKRRRAIAAIPMLQGAWHKKEAAMMILASSIHELRAVTNFLGHLNLLGLRAAEVGLAVKKKKTVSHQQLKCPSYLRHHGSVVWGSSLIRVRPVLSMFTNSADSFFRSCHLSLCSLHC